MKVTILGCSASSGVPVILCSCETCTSPHLVNRRSRSSVWIQSLGQDILIDTSIDFRSQALRAKIPKIDAILYTHPHADHVNGLDDVKIYNFRQKSTITAYGNEWTQRDLFARFGYIFKQRHPQANIPHLTFELIPDTQEKLTVKNLEFYPIVVDHGKDQCFAYRHDDFAYVTDCNSIPAKSLEKLEKLDCLVIDCLRFEPHTTHFHFAQALETIRKVSPKTAILTHLSHEIDSHRHKDLLPKGVFFAYDMMVL